jgi:hypothetical protein
MCDVRAPRHALELHVSYAAEELHAEVLVAAVVAKAVLAAVLSGEAVEPQVLTVARPDGKCVALVRRPEQLRVASRHVRSPTKVTVLGHAIFTRKTRGPCCEITSPLIHK